MEAVGMSCAGFAVCILHPDCIQRFTILIARLKDREATTILCQALRVHNEHWSVGKAKMGVRRQDQSRAGGGAEPAAGSAGGHAAASWRTTWRAKLRQLRFKAAPCCAARWAARWCTLVQRRC